MTSIHVFALHLAGEGSEVGLREVNGFLRNYGELHREVDAWVVLKARVNTACCCLCRAIPCARQALRFGV